MSDFDKKQKYRVAERAVVMPRGAVARDLISVLVGCRVNCEHRLETRAADCIVCPRLVQFARADDGTVTVLCQAPDDKPGRLARGTREMEVPTELCAACKSDEGVRAHPEMVDVYFCRGCFDQMSEPIEWLELGTGD